MKYKAIVTNNRDPLQLGRVAIKCSKLYGDVEKWAQPCFNPNTFSLPPINSVVWIDFEEGDKSRPIWTGVLYTKAQIASKIGTYSESKSYLGATGALKLEGNAVLLNGGIIQVSSDDLSVEANTTITELNITNTGKYQGKQILTE